MLHSLKNAERAMRLQRASRTPRADGRDERCMGLPTASNGSDRLCILRADRSEQDQLIAHVVLKPGRVWLPMCYQNTR